MRTKRNLKASVVMSVLLVGMASAIAAGGTIYVDADASPGGNGASWATAFKYLQDALYKPPTSGDDIWVAEGIYKPDKGGGQTPGDRTATFQLIDGVALYGGFPSRPGLGSLDSRDVALGDLDADGDMDAFVANWNQANKVWLNDGQGNFSDSGQNLGSFAGYGVALGDVDGDGDLDAFVANFASQANKVWLNDGQGNFSDSGQNLGNSTSSDVALGDLDGDGDLDAFVGNYNEANKVWLNDGQGNFSDSGQNLGSFFSLDVALGDLDGDGDLDAFVANSGYLTYQAGKVWLNDGQGNFSDSGQSLGGSLSYGVALGDVDGDGDLDAFVGNYNQANKVWLNDGQGNFSNSGQSLGNSASTDVALGDLDGDGDLDAFVANGASQANKVWINDGQGNFSNSGQSLGRLTSRGMALGDVDGDGDLDGFVANDYSGNNVWLNDGQGTFSSRMEPGLEQRDWQGHPTILSGDIGTVGINSDNSYHVVTYSGPQGPAVLDGFTITAGNANGSSPNEKGGGVYTGQRLIVNNCTFSDNFAYNEGGGMYNYTNLSSTLTNCTFTGNSTRGYGGGMLNRGTLNKATLTNCTFTNNSATNLNGGGMANFDSSPTLINCTFSANRANSFGGGMSNWNNNPTVVNCAFSGNRAMGAGGGAMSNFSNGNPTVTNCILWGNTAPSRPEIYNSSSTPSVTYSDVQGGYSGTGNINADPLFADANLRLSAGSPCIDAGDNSAVPADTADLDNDGDTSEQTPLDLDGRPRSVDGDCNRTGIVDMGAYEFAFVYLGDLDGDCDVDFADFAIFSGNWLLGVE